MKIRHLSEVRLKLGTLSARDASAFSVGCQPSFPRPACVCGARQNPKRLDFRCISAPTYGHDSEVLIYRWPTMKHFRFISKVKVYQVSLMLVLLPLTAHWYTLGSLTGKAFLCGGVSLVGASAVLGIVSHYFSKLVGEMWYSARTDTLRICTLTFWGNRKEAEFLTDSVVTFVESQRHMGGAFQQLEVKGHGETLLWSLRYGRVLDLDLVCKVLKITDIDLSHF